MEEVSRRGGSATITDLATALKLDRTIVYRLVRTLEGENLLESQNGRYRIGSRALMLGNSYLEDLQVVRASVPFQVGLLDRLLKGRPWTTHLLLPIGYEMALVDSVWNTSAPLEMQLSMGRRFPMTTTAAGHSILAYWDREEVVKAIGEKAAAELEPILEAVREAGGLGFARDYIPGASAIGAAIFDRSGRPAAVLLLAGLELEAELTPTSPVAMTIKRTANAISQSLR